MSRPRVFVSVSCRYCKLIPLEPSFDALLQRIHRVFGGRVLDTLTIHGATVDPESFELLRDNDRLDAQFVPSFLPLLTRPMSESSEETEIRLLPNTQPVHWSTEENDAFAEWFDLKPAENSFMQWVEWVRRNRPSLINLVTTRSVRSFRQRMQRRQTNSSTA